jgi:hypothetical protein
VLGEAGPSIRNVQKVLSSTGQALEGETERALTNVLSTAPGIGPITSLRRGIASAAHGENPLKGVDVIPSESDIINNLLS